MKMIIHSIKRDLAAQFGQSKNLNESARNKIRRGWWAAIYLVKAFWVGLKSTRRECLGNEVFYKGRRCMISNWAGSDHPTLAAKGFYEENVPRSEITSILSAREIWHRFGVGFSCYLSAWYSIDIGRRVYPNTTQKPRTSGNSRK